MSLNIDRNAFLAHLFAIWKSIGGHLSQRATLVTLSRPYLRQHPKSLLDPAPKYEWLTPTPYGDRPP